LRKSPENIPKAPEKSYKFLKTPKNKKLLKIPDTPKLGIAKIPIFSKTVIPVIPRTPIKIPVFTEQN
jgi:hypothetical protein